MVLYVICMYVCVCMHYVCVCIAMYVCVQSMYVCIGIPYKTPPLGYLVSCILVSSVPPPEWGSNSGGQCVTPGEPTCWLWLRMDLPYGHIRPRDVFFLWCLVFSVACTKCIFTSQPRFVFFYVTILIFMSDSVGS